MRNALALHSMNLGALVRVSPRFAGLPASSSVDRIVVQGRVGKMTKVYDSLGTAEGTNESLEVDWIGVSEVAVSVQPPLSCCQTEITR